MKETGRALRAAFPHTIPVMTGYLFLGTAFGILLGSKGYGPLWAGGMSLFVFAGSMQFVACGLLSAGFAPAQALLVTLMVNARHLFYGLSMLGPFRELGRSKPYLVFSLTDETFSLYCAAQPPQGVDRERFFLCLAGLDHLYWVAGSLLGGLAGSALQFDTTGIEFVMTALFVVIFLDQWLKNQGRIPAVMGVACAVLCRRLFGPELFLIPTMLLLAAILLWARPVLEREEGERI